MTVVHVVLPGDVDDRRRPSGGNHYDRRICAGLAAVGWSVREHPVPGQWPTPRRPARARLAREFGSLPDGALVLADNLVASAAPAELLAAATRLRLVLIVHMLLGGGSTCGGRETRAAEQSVLSTAAAVVTTSRWTRQRLQRLYTMPGGHVRVIEPGVTPADLVSGTAAGGSLLCVAAVTPAKGHDVLLAALATVRDLPWRCTCVGSLDLRPDFTEHLGIRARELGIADRIGFTGPLTGTDLDGTYAAADLLVLPSLGETYGMVITEALARGLPVVASGIGGVPEALGSTADGVRPGMLVPPGSPQALASALRRWLTDGGHRRRLRTAAVSRRPTLTPWSTAAVRMSQLLATVAAEPSTADGRMSR